jgi:hypothetical protein
MLLAPKNVNLIFRVIDITSDPFKTTRSIQQRMGRNMYVPLVPGDEVPVEENIFYLILRIYLNHVPPPLSDSIDTGSYVKHL